MVFKIGFFIQSFPALLHWSIKTNWWSHYEPGQFFDTYEEALAVIKEHTIQGARIVMIFNPR